MSLINIQGKHGLQYTNDVSEELNPCGLWLGDPFLRNHMPIVIDKFAYLSNTIQCITIYNNSEIQSLETRQKECVQHTERKKWALLLLLDSNMI